MDYPSTYPCPTWNYNQGVAPFVSRTAFDSGWARQRHQWPSKQTNYDMSFSMSTAEFATWSAWVDANGYQWFNMQLDTGAGIRSIRFISPVNYSYTTHDVVVATVTAEAEDG